MEAAYSRPTSRTKELTWIPPENVSKPSPSPSPAAATAAAPRPREFGHDRRRDLVPGRMDRPLPAARRPLGDAAAGSSAGRRAGARLRRPRPGLPVALPALPVGPGGPARLAGARLHARGLPLPL